MPLLGGFRVGRWLGFEIRIDYSWFLIFFLVLWTFSEQVFPGQVQGYGTVAYYAMGISAALLLFGSVLLHELSHSVVARSRGIEVEGITLFIFGGVARTRMEAESAADEFLLTAAGPLASVLLAGVFYALALGARAVALEPGVGVVVENLALINLVLAAFNMIPGFPLDGGRIFRSVVWYVTDDLQKATRWATWGGQAFGYLLIGWGAFLFWEGLYLQGMWAAFIGWFLSSAAQSSYRQYRARAILAQVEAARVMEPDPVVVDPATPVSTLVEEYMLRSPRSAYPVVEGGRVLGLVTVEDVAELSAEDRRVITVAERMTGVDDVPTVAPHEPLDRVVSRLGPGERGHVLVVDGGRLLGVLTMDEVGGWLDRARKLGVEPRTG